MEIEEEEKNNKNLIYEVNTNFNSQSKFLEIDWLPQDKVYPEKILEVLRRDGR